jgi:hypothetical protein
MYHLIPSLQVHFTYQQSMSPACHRCCDLLLQLCWWDFLVSMLFIIVGGELGGTSPQLPGGVHQ